jgi:hypothetical protein
MSKWDNIADWVGPYILITFPLVVWKIIEIIYWITIHVKLEIK